MSLPDFSAIQSMVQALKQAAMASGHRRFLVCSGEAAWCYEQATEALEVLAGERVFFMGDAAHPIKGQAAGQVIEVAPAQKSREWLGREHQNIIFDAHAGFDVDAFGAISGTLCAGGLLVLLVPGLGCWHRFPDPQHQRMRVHPQTVEQVTGRYLQRMASLINASDQLSLMQQNAASRVQPRVDNPLIESNESLPDHCRTQDQVQAVMAIHKVVKGHRKRPLVLTADRGRGKSAALGIAAAQLLLEGVENIAITAPSRNAADILFYHAASVLGEAHAALMANLTFIAPDDLVQTLPVTKLLLVDEAAAIPTPLLEKMLAHYSRIVYATTVHGYEGTGRGFAIRFRKTLDAKTPHWHELKMAEPVRWQPNDPLESFVFKALLLNAAPCELEKPADVQAENGRFREIMPDQLLANETLLNDLFGLLVLAHYQTRPFDLRHLLDGGNMEIYGLFEHGRLVAVLLAAREGGIESNWIDDIWLGKRRVRGHLIPQSLSNQLGIPSAITLQGLRVIRIAVHPDCQRKGLGKVLLHNLQMQADERGLDYLGTLFGATDDLLAFWANSSFNPVRVGVSRDAASGTHSVMMLKPLSRAGEALVDEARGRFLKQFHWLLMEELQQLDPSLVASILAMMPVSASYSLTPDDRQDLTSFTEGLRQYENCIDVVKKAAFRALISGHLSAADALFLVCRVLQNHSWQQVALVCGFSGQKQARQHLRETMRKLSPE